MNTNPLAVRLKNPVAQFLLRKVTRLDDLVGIYDRWLGLDIRPSQNDPAKAQLFLDFALKDMDVNLQISNPELLEAIPKTGPLLIVANHPLGALEGMLLTQHLLRIRPDLKVLVNEHLMRIPEFSDVFVGVDVLAGTPQQRNGAGLRVLHRHLENAGAALIFPSGTVAQYDRKNDVLSDAPWHPMIARLALKHGAACVPMFVHGRNNRSFYLAGLIHKRLRTALLGRAMLSHRGKTIRASVGAAIESTELQALGNAEAVIQYMRLCCEQLADADITLTAGAPTTMRPIVENVEPAQMAAQIQALSPFQVAEHKDFVVFCAPYEALGCVMRQIAIDRERTFRAVSEGTGRELDQDRFDPHYWHLFVWDRKQAQIVGGYRIVKVDQLLASGGINSLYSRSLYHYDHAFVDQLGKSIEVGRSFVCPAYQRQPHALDLLWKGIGAFMVKHPGYHTLFGCVSISREYSQLARKVLADTFLFHYGAASSIRQSVKPGTPVKPIEPAWNSQLLGALVDIPIINKLVGRLSEGRSIPILIRHYLALNGKFISFTVNQGFNDSLDGLILVDLRQAPAKYIDRYFGEAGATAFRELHGVAHAA